MKSKIGLYTALSLVVANMVGTGVFTSLGFQLLGISDFSAIMLLWIAGGVIALFGSFAYSELGAAIPRSGGEYRFLSEIYHPLVGFLSGWISATIGFAAPVAAAAWALGKYVNTIYPTASAQLIGAAVIVLITIIQSLNYKVGNGFQSVSTTLKIVLILVLIVCGLFYVNPVAISVLPTENTWRDVTGASFAISLVYVSYAYSGWNASSYIAGEMKNPKRNIPLSILGGTILVSALYILLNYVFLKTAPVAEMRGVAEVAFVSAKHIFGEAGSKLISAMISLLLVSTISSMIIVGPRVIHAMGEDYPLFALLTRKNKNDIPVSAIMLQSIISLVLLFTSSFDSIITCISFTLTLFSTLTVFGVIIYRIRKPEMERPYKTFGYPYTPLIYLAINIWFLYFVFVGKTEESLVGLGIVALGAVVYFVADFLLKKKQLVGKNEQEIVDSL